MNYRFPSRIIPALAAGVLTIGVLTISAHAQIAGDGIASFDIGNGGPGSGDITNNPNGLSLTGQSGAWASITTGTASATDDGVTLTFNGGTVPIWGGTAGDDRGTGSNSAIRIGSFLGGATDIPWTISGLTAGAFYDMIWYNKRVSPGENRAPNTGVTGFDAGNGVGASAPHDSDKDQNFISVQADGGGNISGTWFKAGGLDDITAVTGVQIAAAGTGVTPPGVTTLSPSNGAIDVSPNVDLVVTFDEDVQKGTGDILIKDFDTDAIVQTIAVTSTDVTISNAVVTIDPPSDLGDNTQYYVEIPGSAIEDLEGTAFAGISGNSTWNFTTGTVDTTAPSLVSTDPFDTETGVALDANLLAGFDEDVKKGTGNILIRDFNTTAIVQTIDVTSGDVAISGADVTINPPSDLGPGTQYYVEIANGAILDLIGNAFTGISGSGTWSFTTASPDVTPPSILFLDPTNGEIDVAVDIEPLAGFDEDVKKGTGNILIREFVGDAIIHTIDVTSGDVTIINGGDVVINPPSNLAAGIQYYIEIPNGAILDLSDNPYAGFTGNSTWSFTTLPPDTTAPGILTLDPGDGATDVALGANLVAGFDEDVKKGTGNILIREFVGDGIVQTIDVTSGDVTVSGADVTINPPSDLAEDTQYYVEIPSGAILDLADNAFTGISGNSIWNFTTAPPRTVSTVVASFNMGNGSPSVSGDVPAANNPNGALMTGTVGQWADLWDNNLSATNNGVTFTFASAGFGGTVGDARGNNVGTDALRMGFSTFTNDVTWTITGLTPNASYDMIWYNKRGAPTTPGGENRAPNSGVDGFNAGNGVGAAGPRDADRDQNFVGVQADGTGTISGTWFVAGGETGITAMAGVQIGSSGGDPGGNDFSDWIALYPGVAGQTGIADDPDGDGNDNAVENFFGTAPDVYTAGLNAGGVTTVTVDGDTFTFTHPQNSNPADDLTPGYRWSTDLQDFYDDGAANGAGTTTVSFSAQVDTPEAGTTTVTATITGSVIPDKLFVDVEVTQN